MDYLDKLKAWKWLMDEVKKIPDPDRKIYHDALVAKAIDEWGFNPDRVGSKKPQTEKIELEPWQEEFLNVLKDSDTYGFLVKSSKKEFKQSMYEFVREGGRLADIPKDMRTAYIMDEYFMALRKWYFE